MREIKFRGKRLNGRLKFNKSITRLENGSVRLGGYAVIPETVGQYTGLIDNNGVENLKIVGNIHDNPELL